MRILFVALSNSITTARWIDQLGGTGWDLHLFPAERGVRHHPQIQGVTLHDCGLCRPEDVNPEMRVQGLWPFRKGGYRVQRLLEGHTRWRRDRAQLLAATIKRLKPDMVHSIEMQRAGYLTLAARKKLEGKHFPPWIYSCWGNDIYLFHDRPEHTDRVSQVLAAADYFTADCERDVQLAKKHGFRSTVLGVFPGPGGFDVAQMRALGCDIPASARKTIAVKGYQSSEFGGRALVALQALHRCADVLKGHRIVIYSAAPEVRAVAAHIAGVTGLSIDILLQSEHDAVVRLLGGSRIHLALSVSDGTPNAMLEAMVMGAFPVQSDTLSTAEWIEPERNGLLVPAEDPLAVERAIRTALKNDILVDRAAEINTGLTRDRIDRSVVQPRVLEMYKRVAAETSKRRHMA